MPVARFLAAIVGAVFIAALLIRPAAPGSKLAMHYLSMQADLRNLAAAQEEFRRDSARYARSLDELGRSRYQTSSGVTVEISAASDTAWRARAGNSYAPEYSCHIAASSGGGDPQTDTAPACEPEYVHRRWRWAWNH